MRGGGAYERLIASRVAPSWAALDFRGLEFPGLADVGVGACLRKCLRP